MKRYNLFMMFALAIMLVGSASALDYLPHKQATDLTFSVNSPNSTSCNVTTMETLSGITLFNKQMTKNGNNFYYTVTANNFTGLGNYCFNVDCRDSASNTASGSICREVTPSGKNGNSNIVFIVLIVVVIYAIAFIGFFGKNEIVTLIGGMFMIALSVYMINNGLIVYRDWITNYFAYLTFAVGAFFAIFSSISLIEND